jgi:hypothetical protein
VWVVLFREWVVLGGTGQVGNSSTEMNLADAHKIADRAIQVGGLIYAHRKVAVDIDSIQR